MEQLIRYSLCRFVLFFSVTTKQKDGLAYIRLYIRIKLY